MSTAFDGNDLALLLSKVPQINEICDRFEADLRTGKRPRAEDYLGEASRKQPGRLCCVNCRPLRPNMAEGRKGRFRCPTAIYPRPGLLTIPSPPRMWQPYTKLSSGLTALADTASRGFWAGADLEPSTQVTMTP